MDNGSKRGSGTGGCAQEKTRVQRGDTQENGGSATQAMGCEENQRAGGLENSEAVGLCFDCGNSRVIRSDRGSIFYLCRLSLTDPNFAKYPRLPVLSCSGYRREPAGS